MLKLMIPPGEFSLNLFRSFYVSLTPPLILSTLLRFSLLYLTITYDQVLIHLWIKLVYVYVEEIW